jgi:hypothetical protein
MYDKQAMYREIEAYMQHINFAYNCYEAYISLCDINERYNDVLNLSPGFFTITQFSLSKCLLLETAKLFCGSKDERTMQKLIRIVQSNNSVFEHKNAKTLCDEVYNTLANRFANTIDRIKARRDQDLSHNDPLFFYDDKNPAEENYISPAEIEELLLYVFGFCNELLESVPCDEKVILMHGANDISTLVEKFDLLLRGTDEK